MDEPNEKLEGRHARASPRGIVLGLRVVLLLLAAAAVGAAVWVGRSRDRASRDSGARYSCPMHPEVKSAAPGPCPICGMDLEAITASAAAGAIGAIHPSTYLNYDVIRRRGTGPDAPAPAWVDADGAVWAVVYRDELEVLPPDARAVFRASASPEGGTELRADLGSQRVWDRSTSLVRFRVEAADAAASPPRAGDAGWVRLVDKGRELPLIASTAILEGAEGAYVMVASRDGRTLARRPVAVGKSFAGLTFVLSGLREHEHVLVRSAFFADAERKIHQKEAIEVKP